MKGRSLAHGLSSVGAHFALTTTGVLVAVLALVFTELTAREHTRSLEARRSAAESVTTLFSNSASAALIFEDAKALEKEIDDVRATPSVVGATLFHEGDAEPVAVGAE